MLYGCETLSLTLREERRLKLFENRILMRIFGARRDGNREWKRLHNEELHGLYHSDYKIRITKFRRLRWVDRVARMGEGISSFKILTGKEMGKSPLRKA